MMRFTGDLGIGSEGVDSKFAAVELEDTVAVVDMALVRSVEFVSFIDIVLPKL